MSYGITAIAVDLKRIEALQSAARSVFRKGKARVVLQQLTTEEAEQFERFDEMLDDVLDPDEPRPAISFEVALTNLVFGRAMNGQFGFLYGYALEMLCLHYGERLPNRHWSGMGSDWGETVQQGLTDAGVDERVISVRHWMYRGAPLKIPAPDDFPSIGYVRAAEVSPALIELQKATADSLNEEVAESVDEVRHWLTTCQVRQCDLVSFYY